MSESAAKRLQLDSRSSMSPVVGGRARSRIDHLAEAALVAEEMDRRQSLVTPTTPQPPVTAPTSVAAASPAFGAGASPGVSGPAGASTTAGLAVTPVVPYSSVSLMPLVHETDPVFFGSACVPLPASVGGFTSTATPSGGEAFSTSAARQKAVSGTGTGTGTASPNADSSGKRGKVSRACVRCKAAKTCCDDQRPCRRCVRLGVETECVDAEQRKPGRKRKNPDGVDGARSGIPSTLASATNTAPATPPMPMSLAVAASAASGTSAASGGAGSGAALTGYSIGGGNVGAVSASAGFPVQTPTSLQFVSPSAPRPAGAFSASALPRLIDSSLVGDAVAALGGLGAGPYDRRHPLYITPDALPNPERGFLHLNAALSIAARAGDGLGSSAGAADGGSLLDLADQALSEAAAGRARPGSWDLKSRLELLSSAAAAEQANSGRPVTSAATTPTTASATTDTAQPAAVTASAEQGKV